MRDERDEQEIRDERDRAPTIEGQGPHESTLSPPSPRSDRGTPPRFLMNHRAGLPIAGNTWQGSNSTTLYKFRRHIDIHLVYNHF